MEKKLLRIPLCLALLLALSVSVRADSGPKPSVTVTVTGLHGEPYWATLLSETQSTGPYSARDEPYHRQYFEGEEGHAIWETFQSYEDSDGYYFLQWHAEGRGDGEFRWGYYPPGKFKVLLYFPENDAFVVSNVAERYAFDSYYAVDLSGVALKGGARTVTAKRSYDYAAELAGLLVRIALTVAIELGVAWLFRYRRREDMRLILRVNVVTQLLLNGALNWISYRSGRFFAISGYILLEIVVFLAEAAIYRRRLTKSENSRPVWYAFAANAASFALGLVLADRLPGVF